MTDSSKIPSSSIDDNLTNFDTATSVYVNALANGGEIVHYSTDNTFLSNLQAWSCRFFFLSVTLYVSEKRSSIHWKNVTIFPGGIIIGLKGVFDILNKIIKSNQQSVQTLVSLLTFTSLMFLLALMTYVGSWFLTFTSTSFSANPFFIMKLILFMFLRFPHKFYMTFSPTCMHSSPHILYMKVKDMLQTTIFLKTIYSSLKHLESFYTLLEVKDFFLSSLQRILLIFVRFF